MTQHDDHCILNVNHQLARIVWQDDAELGVIVGGRSAVINLKGIDWVAYNQIFENWFADLRRIEERQAEIKLAQIKERQCLAKNRQVRIEEDMARERRAAARRHELEDRALDTDADRLEAELLMVDLEETDAELAVAIDCQRLSLPMHDEE